MRVTEVDPQQLRTAVRDAVAGGAWSPMAVVAAVATDFGADRTRIMATLWDLAADGELEYCCGQFPAFRMAPTSRRSPTAARNSSTSA
jgi:hypothetical protein